MRCHRYWDADGNFVHHSPDENEHHDVYGEYDHHYDDHGNKLDEDGKVIESERIADDHGNPVDEHGKGGWSTYRRC